MSRCLHPCPSCARHLRAGETACPFCDAQLPPGFGACKSASGASGARGRPLSRAALLFVGATVTAACGGQTESVASGDGGHDAASEGGGYDTDGAPVAMYGPGPVPAQDAGPRDASPDAAPDGPVDASDAGGFPVMYGPAPVDSG